MTDLKNIDFKILRHMVNDNTILLRTGTHTYELNVAEILGIVTVLSKLTNELLEELCTQHIKDTL